MQETRRQTIRNQILLYFLLGFSVAVVLFGVLDRLSREVVSIELVATDFVSRKEEPYVEAFQKYIDDHDYGLENSSELKDWADDNHIPGILITDKRQVLLEYQTATTSYYTYRTDSVEAHLTSSFICPLTLKGRTVDVFIDTGLVFRIYRTARFACLGVSVLVWIIILTLGIRKVIRRIRLLDSEISVAATAQDLDLNHPITVKGADELSHLAFQVDRARAELLDLNRKREKREKERQEFVSGVSHDLRTPITIILNYLELAQRAQTMKEVGTYLDKIKETTLELGEMTDDLFDSFILNDKTKVSLLGPERTRSAFGDHFSELILMLKEEGFEVNTDRLDFPEVPVRFSPSFMSRIVSNLLSNIEKYAEPGSCIEIYSNCTDETVSFTVENKIAYQEMSNHGTGIGTRNISNMMRLMKGKSKVRKESEKLEYAMTLVFPIDRGEGEEGGSNETEIVGG